MAINDVRNSSNRARLINKQRQNAIAVLRKGRYGTPTDDPYHNEVTEKYSSLSCMHRVRVLEKISKARDDTHRYSILQATRRLEATKLVQQRFEALQREEILKRHQEIKNEEESFRRKLQYNIARISNLIKENENLKKKKDLKIENRSYDGSLQHVHEIICKLNCVAQKKVKQ